MMNDDADALKVLDLTGIKSWPRCFPGRATAGERTAEGGAELPAARNRPIPPAGQQRTGWISPVYNVSRFVKIDIPTVLNNRCIAVDTRIPEVEVFRILRALILRRLEQRSESRTLLVTSAVPREGKTTTAINLALTLAKEFSQTALLVDCDFRQQQVHYMLSYDSKVGLVDHLLYDIPFPEIVVWPGIKKLTVISGGKPSGSYCELLSSPGMRQVIAEMKARYPERYLVLDAPPVLTCADTLALAPLVDGIVVVVREGKTSRHDIVRAMEMLPRDKVVGIVLNRMPKNA